MLDLDNTLWVGVIGDDGVEGIALGQGSGAGEAFVAIQRMALELRSRGIELAVGSKNEEAAALLPFTQHPEMLLKTADIAVFRANWTDKASNLRAIANHLHGDEIAYTQRIVDAVRAHGTQVAFVYIPYYSGPPAIGERDFYAARGTLHEAGFFADQDAMYQGWAHLNRKGTEAMTDWLSERIAPLLGEAPKK